MSSFKDKVKGFLTDLQVGDNLERNTDTACERMKLFATLGTPEQKVKLSIQGCNDAKPELPRTDHNGIAISDSVNLGTCSFASSGSSTLTLKASGEDDAPATVYFSPPHGLGVISDIDDTIKITNVTDHDKMAQNTLYKDPLPVPGMPELYKSLAQSLTTETIPPQFLYVSGSPMQLQPFLSSFLNSTYPASKGPIFLQTFSIFDLPKIFESLGSGADAEKIEYKVSQITRIQKMYPQKSFLAIGDSGEMDPEVYGEVYRRFGKDFIRCIWIRKVSTDPDAKNRKVLDAKNNPARFVAAFKGVPTEKTRVYEDEDIESLEGINVAGSQC